MNRKADSTAGRGWFRAVAWLLVLAGVSAVFLAIAADWLGLGAEPGFGWNQFALLASGLIMILAGGLVLLVLGSRQAGKVVAGTVEAKEACRWPGAPEAGLAFALAVLATVVDIQISQSIGLLSAPPVYDGAYYMLEAKSTFYRLSEPTSDPLFVLRDLIGGRFPVYKWLMLLNYLVLGEGEWQSYAVRFWPMFLLLLLVLWVVRRRAGIRLAAAAAVFTVLLPPLSNGLRSASGQFFDLASVGRTWYLSDLRPDLLFAVLLTCAVVVLLEHAHTVSRGSWLVSGACAALAILTKSSALPVLLLGWGLAVAYVLFVNRIRLWTALGNSAWGVAGLAFLLAPWIAMGGANQTLVYVYELLTIRRATYSSPNATLLSEAYYYWSWFPSHMGAVAGWAFLAAGFLAAAVLMWKPVQAEKGRLLAYLILSAALYALVSATPTKNYFLGLTFYIPLWIFSWASLSSLARDLLSRYRSLGAVFLSAALLYLVAVGARGVYAWQHWPAEKKVDGPHNRITTLQIAADTRALLRNDEVFLSLPAFGFPNALQYYMVDETGGYPMAIGVDSAGAPAPEQYALETTRSSKVVLVYAEDAEEIADSGFAYIYPPRIPYFRAITQLVSQPNSQYRLTRAYRFSHHQKGVQRFFTVYLYVRGSSEKGT